MKKIISLLLTSFLITMLYSQSNTNLQEFIGLSFGRSFHGTGDLRGVAFNSVYSKEFGKKYSWVATIGGTLHDGEWDLFYDSPGTGERIDGSIRYTTGGIQSTFGVNYNLIQFQRSAIYLGLNALLRYQSTSYYDGVVITYPPVTGYPIPLINFVNLTPARTIAVGGTLKIGYNYATTKNILFGILGEFQIDTNGDALNQIGLIVGKRF